MPVQPWHRSAAWHHQAKQASGWHLAQTQPGVMTWTLPSSRSYTTRPEPYPI